jgi:hypothetical protein
VEPDLGVDVPHVGDTDSGEICESGKGGEGGERAEAEGEEDDEEDSWGTAEDVGVGYVW